MSNIADINFLSDNMDLVAGTNIVSFHVSCSSLHCSLDFCLLLHAVQILSQSLLFGRMLTIYFFCYGLLNGQTIPGKDFTVNE